MEGKCGVGKYFGGMPKFPLHDCDQNSCVTIGIMQTWGGGES